MRKIIFYLVVGFFTAGCAGNDKKPAESSAGIILGGEHELRKMSNFSGDVSSISGNFFIFSSKLTQETKDETCVKFAWKMNDSTYAISSLAIEKLRIKFNDSIATPTIKFRWVSATTPVTQELMDKNVVYAVITIRQSDWPANMQLPLNN